MKLRCSKMSRIRQEKSAELSCVHFTRLLALLLHYLKKNSNPDDSSENWQTFSSNKFDPATGVRKDPKPG